MPPPAPCPFADRVAGQLAGPGGRLDDPLADHLRDCPDCRRRVAENLLARTATAPAVADWLTVSAPVDPAAGLSALQAMMLAEGRAAELELGPYLLVDRLGAGGMGEVFRGWHRLIRRLDAVKRIRPEIAADPTAVRRFLREAQAAAGLSHHPNVVAVHTADHAAGGYYLAMEYVPGSDLGRVVKADGPLPIPLAVEYARQAALGLQHAAEHGLVHRDVKPSNLLVTADRRTVKVADFGLARPAAAAADELTASGKVVGTCDYMAPEQASDARSADARSDLYSLGCTLYFLLAGEPPFPGGLFLEKLMRHATEPAPDVAVVRPDVPRPVAAVVARLMAKKPADRYPTAAAAADALARLLDGAAQLPARPADTRTVDRTRGRSDPTVADRRKPARRGRPVFIGCVIVLPVALLAVAGGWFLSVERLPAGAVTAPTSKGEEPRPEPPKPPEVTPPPVTDPNSPWAPTPIRFDSDRTGKVKGVGFGPSGEVIAVRWGEASWEEWPAAGGRPTRAVRPDGEGDDQRAIAPDGRYLLGGSGRLWDGATGRLARELGPELIGLGTGARLEYLDRAAFAADGKSVAAGVSFTRPGGGQGRALAVWEAAGGHPLKAWELKGAGRENGPVAIAPDGRRLAAAVGRRVYYVNRDSDDLLTDWLAEDGSPVAALALNPKVTVLYIAHADGRVVCWSTMERKKLWGASLRGAGTQAAAITADARWLAVGGPGLTLWDVGSEKPREHVLLPNDGHDVCSVAFSPDGRRLVSGGGMRGGRPYLRVWELRDGGK